LQKNVKYYYKNGQYLVSAVYIGNIQCEIPFATDMQGEYAKDISFFRKLMLFTVVNGKFTV